MTLEQTFFADQSRIDSIRRDLNRLMWIEPFNNRGTFDPGWSCRDHAFVFGILLKLEGLRPKLSHGKNMVVVGSRAGLPPVGLGQEAFTPASHTWVRTEGHTIVDLSPNLGVSVGSWKPLHFGGIVGTVRECALPASVVITSDEDEYANEVNIATHSSEHVTCVYFERSTEQVDSALTADPFLYVNSPLTDRLRRDFDGLIYLKAVSHLRGLLSGVRRPVAGLSQNKAWKVVAEIADADAIELRELIAAA